MSCLCLSGQAELERSLTLQRRVAITRFALITLEYPGDNLERRHTRSAYERQAVLGCDGAKVRACEGARVRGCGSARVRTCKGATEEHRRADSRASSLDSSVGHARRRAD